MRSGEFGRGLAIRHAVLDEAYVDSGLWNVADFNRTFQKLVTEYRCGRIWNCGRPIRRQRNRIDPCMLAAPNPAHEFGLHFGGALRSGSLPDEPNETPQQITTCCGTLAEEAKERSGATKP